MSRSTVVEGPDWCTPGLDSRGGRYPLSVEAAVMTMVDTLLPGISTLTRFARYYSLYWALADFAAARNLDSAECRIVLRRAEVALALASLAHDQEPAAHGVDRVRTLLDRGTIDTMAESGASSYSPRAWGFWAQYNGPSSALGTVEVQAGALRPGRHPCPAAVLRMFHPMLEVVARQPFPVNAVEELAVLRLEAPDTPDLAPLSELFTATRSGRHAPDDWNGNDRTRRTTLRLLTRALQLHPDMPSWSDAFRTCLAYGAEIQSDPVLSAEADHAYAWRGVLLRHHSVGAWRRLWAGLVQCVSDGDGTVTREDLHEWISSEVPAMTVQEFLAGCPPITGTDGHPHPAEEQLHAAESIAADLAILLLGGLRLEQLADRTRAAFLGTTAHGRGQFLDPKWVDFRRLEHESRPVRELARAFVDDMLAQSRRVALRKLQVGPDGRMTMFSKLHERNGRYFATGLEGSGNVGLRIEQLGFLAAQLGLVDGSPPEATVSPLGAELLALPS